jgi:hypothetical protein
MPLITGYTTTENITICKVDGGSILDTNGQLYGVRTEMVKMEIEDNKIITADVEYGFGEPIIYSVYNPVVCAGSCGGV